MSLLSGKRARTDFEKHLVVDALYVAWCETEDIRLGQFLRNVVAPDSLFYIEDDALLAHLTADVRVVSTVVPHLVKSQRAYWRILEDLHWTGNYKGALYCAQDYINDLAAVGIVPGKED